MQRAAAALAQRKANAHAAAEESEQAGHGAHGGKHKQHPSASFLSSSREQVSHAAGMQLFTPLVSLYCTIVNQCAAPLLLCHTPAWPESPFAGLSLNVYVQQLPSGHIWRHLVQNAQQIVYTRDSIKWCIASCTLCVLADILFDEDKPISLFSLWHMVVGPSLHSICCYQGVSATVHAAVAMNMGHRDTTIDMQVHGNRHAILPY